VTPPFLIPLAPPASRRETRCLRAEEGRGAHLQNHHAPFRIRDNEIPHPIDKAFPRFSDLFRTYSFRSPRVILADMEKNSITSDTWRSHTWDGGPRGRALPGGSNL